MGSGPVVIGDDGSPPPGLRGTGLRIGRMYEFMQQLENSTDCHTVIGVKAISGVSVNGRPQTISGSNILVEITGDTGTKITISSDGTAVKVCTTGTALTEDLFKHWARYKAGDQSIAKVLINGQGVSLGASNRVEIFVSP